MGSNFFAMTSRRSSEGALAVAVPWLEISWIHDFPEAAVYGDSPECGHSSDRVMQGNTLRGAALRCRRAICSDIFGPAFRITRGQRKSADCQQRLFKPTDIDSGLRLATRRAMAICLGNTSIHSPGCVQAGTAVARPGTAAVAKRTPRHFGRLVKATAGAIYGSLVVTLEDKD
ncbi:hypothetical protein CERSUDRAFT_124696 [Gelatoporia subvermispora B]|uniref:Uncharacterized protein n=1 Tax=Ceriporiopsis subvermispora (strain B) TaxID=914234 RepID=M2PH45_CERS8|nr:hypothetical protein CERSUDRAFT_124696 [Gelatoporia subvermispora B]